MIRRLLFLLVGSAALAACDSGLPNLSLPALGTCAYSVTKENGHVLRVEQPARFHPRSDSRSSYATLVCEPNLDPGTIERPYLDFVAEGFIASELDEPFNANVDFGENDAQGTRWVEPQGRAVLDVRNENEIGGRFRFRLEEYRSGSNLPKVVVEGAFRARVPAPQF